MGFDLPPIINDNCVALSINRSPSYDSCAVSSKHCIIIAYRKFHDCFRVKQTNRKVNEHCTFDNLTKQTVCLALF